MTHPTDPVAAMREALKFYASMSSWTLTPREGTARTMHLSDAEIDMGKRARDALALPLPARDDAVRSATERVVNAWRRMDAHGSDAELRRAVDALYEAWTDAAERAQDAKGGDRG